MRGETLIRLNHRRQQVLAPSEGVAHLISKRIGLLNQIACGGINSAMP